MNHPQKREFKPIQGLYEDWFLEYSSYVILERAVPLANDGLKPVQRRILHALKEMDDGRFNKVANVIGQTMQYHPHGDASITDAMVNLGQKDLLIETQGNWGDYRTGDSAAAARYIEGRLSKFALDVAFNPKTTQWQLSYDGRKNEPVFLPMKFPLLLAQGAEGIAVGLSTKILPHNFCELIDASIKYLKGKSFELLPDFPTGGMMDASDYKDGQRGGKVRVRSIIQAPDKKSLLIKSVPFGVTTQTLIESIIRANDKGKIKIKKVQDNTAKDVEIEVQLAPGVSTDIAIDALYAFTDCEISISPNTCVILDDKPIFTTVTHLLKYNTDNSKNLLQIELEIKLNELEEQWHFSSLEKIFIEKRIYRDIEEETTWEGVISAIDKGLTPFKKLFKRIITQEDIVKLTEIRIKRISKFDSFKADELIKNIENQITDIKNHLEHLVEFTIEYYKNILAKYGKGKERKTQIRTFDTIELKQIALINTKLYANYKEGFIGTSLKKDDLVFECSDMDDIIVFKRDGTMVITKVDEKTFVGKDILKIEIFDKNDDRTTYNMLYADGHSGICYAKRFNVTAITRDKQYPLTKSDKGSKILYFSSNPNGEAEIVTITLSPNSKARNKIFDFYFEDLTIKGRSSQGNIVTKYGVKSVKFKAKGQATLDLPVLFYDKVTGRLNFEGIGVSLGKFDENDLLIAFYKDGNYEVLPVELSSRFEDKHLMLLEKFNPNSEFSLIYWDNDKKYNLVKRFTIETSTLSTKFAVIKEGALNEIKYISSHSSQLIRILSGKSSAPNTQDFDLNECCEISSYKLVGIKLIDEKIISITNLSEEKIIEQSLF